MALPATPETAPSSRHEAAVILAAVLLGGSVASALSGSQELVPQGRRPGTSADLDLVLSGGSLPAPDSDGGLFSVGDGMNTSEAINGPYALPYNTLADLLDVLEEHNIGYFSPFLFNDTPYPISAYWFELIITGNAGQSSPVIGVLIDEPWWARLNYPQRLDFLGRGYELDSLYTSEYTPREWVEQRIPQWFPNGMPGSTGEFVDLSDPWTPATLPPALATLQNYPNPFNGTSRIAFTLPDAAQMRIECYDIRGDLILREEMGTMGAGLHEWPLEMPEDQASGQIFYMLFKDGEAFAKGTGSHIK